MPPEATLQRVGRALRELRLEHVIGEPPGGVPITVALDAAFGPRAGVARADPSSLAAAVMRARRAGRDPAAAARVPWAHARARTGS